MLVEDRVGHLHGDKGRFVSTLPKSVGLLNMSFLVQDEVDVAPESFTGRIHRVRLLSQPADREHLYPYQHLYELDRPCVIDDRSISRIVVSRVCVAPDIFEVKIFVANGCGWVIGDEFYSQDEYATLMEIVRAFCDGETGY